MEEEKKKGVVEKSGEELGKVANKGVGVVKGFGKNENEAQWKEIQS